MSQPSWLRRLGDGSLGDIVSRLEPHRPGIPKQKLLKWAAEKKVEASRLLRAYDFLAELQPEIAELLDNGEAGLVREDLYDVLLAFVLEDVEARNVLDLMHDVVSEKHYRMIEIAIAADNLRLNGLDTKAQSLVEDAERKFGPDARKINALYAAGYVLNNFAWKLAWEKAMDPKKGAAKFNQWFLDQLRFFEDAIFVNNQTEKTDIWSGIEGRLFGRTPRSSMRIWAAGVDNIRKTSEVLDAMIAERKKKGQPGIDYAARAETYGKAIAFEFLVFKDGLPGMIRKHLPMLWEKGNQ